MAAALYLALKGKHVVIYFMNRGIMKRDKTDFDKIINFKKLGNFPGAGSINLEYGLKDVGG